MRRLAFYVGLLSLWGGLLSAQVVAASQWDLQDVSYLYPLPANSVETRDFLLGPQAGLSKGPLLPASVFQMVPTLNDGGIGQNILYSEALRVVAMRVDPCAARGSGLPCQPEVRLIWQPIVVDSELGWTTEDAAVHTFYALKSEDLRRLVISLAALKEENRKEGVNTAGLDLTLHAGFKNSQRKATFLSELNRIVSENCGEANLNKITFMRLLTANVWWRFGGFEKVSERWTAVSIPRLTIGFQDIFNSAPEVTSRPNFPGVEMDAIFNIQPDSYPSEDDLTTVINHSFRFGDYRDREDFAAKLGAVDRFQNPHLTNPHALDCASCHYADAARFYIQQRFPELVDWRSSWAYSPGVDGAFNFANSTIEPRATRVIRAFGYFGNQPAVNTRVIHDSAESALWLNAHPESYQ